MTDHPYTDHPYTGRPPDADVQLRTLIRLRWVRFASDHSEPIVGVAAVDEAADVSTSTGSADRRLAA